jgi:hypothetical protein
MEYLPSLPTVLLHIGFTLVFIGLRKLGRPNAQGLPDPTGFLYQAAGATTMSIAGCFMPVAAFPIIFWNIAFGLISLNGYWRLTRRW